jgi:hypothetical protein
LVKTRLICAKTVAASVAGEVDFGLQDVDQAVHPGQHTKDGSLQFECELRARLDDEKKTVRFYGAFVHGPTADRFVYLSWKRQVTTDGMWVRRLKIPLSGITWQQVRGLKDGQALQCRVGEDHKGAQAVVSWAVVQKTGKV